MNNREAILAASDERLNQWAAEKVMGWHKGMVLASWGNNAWADKEGIITYPFASKFCPLTDIAQAMALLPLAGANWSIEGDKYESNFRCSIKTNGNPSRWVSHAGGSLPRAITIAALLAVAAMEGER
jgi:hypothetical protein